ncbi:hypothetical protein K461DRAFT_89084 [Myriangium duriaei CBS 260.36]|uniref:DUF4187 domain-containing protein n=1 Tax=Myriangium duriaei CBS 260.36 TaxID=1168546 RepID=A0A9P4J6P5_9PEZI|nr:hypothetical protein K461DRAFT_89084 [Myriangium duriaei CBS 260.36]
MTTEDAGDFRVRMAREKAEKVAEGRGRAAGRVGETLYAQMASGGEEKTEEGEREVPVFVRAVRAEQRAKEERMARGREKAARLARMEVQGEEGGEGLDDDEADVVARGETVRGLQGIGDGEDEEEDAELEEFLTLSAEERLERTVRWLRQEFHYCFWCKAQYDDEEMEGCPGVGEEVHG